MKNDSVLRVWQWLLGLGVLVAGFGEPGAPGPVIAVAALYLGCTLTRVLGNKA